MTQELHYFDHGTTQLPWIPTNFYDYANMIKLLCYNIYSVMTDVLYVQIVDLNLTLKFFTTLECFIIIAAL